MIPKNIYTITQVGSSHISPLLLEIQKCSTCQFRHAFQLTSSFHLGCFLNIFKPEKTTTWKNVTYIFSLLKSRTNNSHCCLDSSPIDSHLFQALKIPTYGPPCLWNSEIPPVVKAMIICGITHCVYRVMRFKF